MRISPARKAVISLYSGRKSGRGDPEGCGLEDRPPCGEVSALQISVTAVTRMRLKSGCLNLNPGPDSS